MLPLGLTAEALAAAAAEAEPDSLAAADRMRVRFGPSLAAAAVTQVVLRRRAVAKFGPVADQLFFTRDGLEQATRPAVAAHHAQRILAAGARRALDLGCGIGTDALALADAGLEVVAVDIDAEVAEVARANLAGRAEVLVGDAEELAPRLLAPGTAVFCDPARRNRAGRVWRVEDFRPPWSFVLSLLEQGTASGRTVGVKLGPALPHTLIPAGVEAEWVSVDGNTVEVGLWSGRGADPGRRVAMVLPDHRLVAPAEAVPLAVTGVRRYVYEPDGAVIRAGAVGRLGGELDASLLDPQIAYLTADRLVASPFATAYEVLDVLAPKGPALRRWVRDHHVGTLEIKKRGLDLDPAELRRRLKPKGPQRVTLILSRTPGGAVALVVRRLLAG